MVQHNKIYENLVKGPDDAVGAFAYALYKQHKVEWTKDIQARYNRPPTPQEVDGFHSDNILKVQLDAYLQRGETLASYFLQAGLEQKILEMEASVKASALADRFTDVEKKLDDRRGVKSWLRDIGTNVVVNILTVLAIGAVIIGSKLWSDFNNFLDGKYGNGAAGQHQVESSNHGK